MPCNICKLQGPYHVSSQLLKQPQPQLLVRHLNPWPLACNALQFSLDDSSVTVGLGKTRVLGAIKATLDAPYPDRPSEGSVFFNVEFSPMASPAFEPGRPGQQSLQHADTMRPAANMQARLCLGHGPRQCAYTAVQCMHRHGMYCNITAGKLHDSAAALTHASP